MTWTAQQRVDFERHEVARAAVRVLLTRDSHRRVTVVRMLLDSVERQARWANGTSPKPLPAPARRRHESSSAAAEYLRTFAPIGTPLREAYRLALNKAAGKDVVERVRYAGELLELA